MSASEPTWVFAYGSLVTDGPALAEPSGMTPRLAELSGVVRSWGVAMENRDPIHDPKHYVDRETGERPGVCVAFLDIAEREGGGVNGTLIPFTGSEPLADLDVREQNYERRMVSRGQISAEGEVRGDIYVYAGLASSRERCGRAAREDRLVVGDEYLEYVIAGFSSLGPGALDRFWATPDADMPPVEALALASA